MEIKQDDLIYSINEDEETVKIVRCQKSNSELIIPSSINHESKKYYVVSISQFAFIALDHIKSVKFAPDSKFQVIDKEAFSRTSIESISIPAHVTRICEESFIFCQQLRRIEIPKNSELQTIEKDAFHLTEIEMIFIPENLTNLEEGWCSATPKLTAIEVDEKNPRYSYIENQFLVGKSDLENEEYDVLVFARRDIIKATIPPFIKTIGPYAFDSCCFEIDIPSNSKLQTIGHKAFCTSNIKKITISAQVTQICSSAFLNCKRLSMIEIPVNSKLQKIGKYAFSDTEIESIFIPESLTDLEEGWLSHTNKLTAIEVDEKNPRYSYIENQFLVGKSDLENEDYDILVFARRDIIKATIPPFIKTIGPYAFFNCNELQHIFIPQDSKLQTIGDDAFNSTGIKESRFQQV